MVENSGVYVVWLHLPQSETVKIGKLGDFIFPQGVYAYAGSAQRNLKARIKRHQRQEKRPHWHIDYLRQRCHYLGSVVFLGEPKQGECLMVRELLKIPGSYLPVPGFGSSDCKCQSHLVFNTFWQSGSYY